MSSELSHYGVKGMKWGVRKDPIRSDGLTGRAARKANRIENRANKRISKVTRERDKFLDARRRNQRKSAAKYDAKIAKAKNEGDDYKVSTLSSKKAHTQNVWSSASKDYKKGYDYYNKVERDYAKTRVKALQDKSYKKSEAYKLAGKKYINQRLSDLNNSRTMTILGYSDKKQRTAIDTAHARNKAIKKVKNDLYKAQDKAETRHENKQIATNKKYGQYGNNYDGKNRKLSRNERKAYDSETKANWATYISEMDSAKASYKDEKKKIKKSYK